jgi:soluble cytochrome b562
LDTEALTLAVKEWVEAEGGAEVIQKRLTEQMAANNEEIQKYKESIALSATSVDDLNDKLAEGTIDIEHYDMALQNAFEQEAAAEDLDVKELTEYAEALLESKTALVETREEAYRLSMAHAKMERGIDTLSDSWDSWNDIMKNGNESQKL